jgi:hypothetical protein
LLGWAFAFLPGRGHASRFFDFIAALGWTGRYLARVRDRVGRPAEFDIRLTRAKKRG